MSQLTSSIKPLRPLIDSQFLRSRDLQHSGPAQHLLYSTGRRNVLSLHTTILLTPIHDLFALVVHFGKSIIEPTYDGGEHVVFNLTLGRGEDGQQGEGLGVWAVSDKSVMRQIREKRWDLVSCGLEENATKSPAADPCRPSPGSPKTPRCPSRTRSSRSTRTSPRRSSRRPTSA